MTIRSSPASTPTIDVMSLLQGYDAFHTKGTNDFKSSIWNLTKARRERGYLAGGGGFGGVVYSVNDVREFFCARAVLECERGKDPLLLLDEEEKEKEDEGICRDQTDHIDSFILHLDGMKKTASIVKQDAEVTESKNNDSEGLRRRLNAVTLPMSVTPKNTNGGDKKYGVWTTEEPLDHVEEQLRDSDPLSLFGVPPTALRDAQRKAREALAGYVDAANLAAEILRLTSQERVPGS